MTSFSAKWLALREPADRAARCLTLTRAVAARFATDHPLSVLDLGAGTGSNLRYLAEHLPREQQWLLVDHDAQLLEQAPSALRGDHFLAEVTTRPLDLRVGVHDGELYANRELISASALLDLVSEEWLQTLVERCAQQRATALFVLSYDGRIVCTPSEPEDQTIRELVNRHQHTDKGFGPAAGPDAIEIARERFVRMGYDVTCEPSDWVLSAEHGELQRELIRGWASAAHDTAPERATMIDTWLTRRLAHIDAHTSQIIVGHMDLAAFPGRV